MNFRKMSVQADTCQKLVLGVSRHFFKSIFSAVPGRTTTITLSKNSERAGNRLARAGLRSSKRRYSRGTEHKHSMLFLTLCQITVAAFVQFHTFTLLLWKHTVVMNSNTKIENWSRSAYFAVDQSPDLYSHYKLMDTRRMWPTRYNIYIFKM